MKIIYFFCIVCGIYSFKTQPKVLKNTQLNTLPIRNYQNFRQYPISRPYYKNYLNRISDKGLQLGSNRTKNNKDEGEQMIENILNRNETTKNEFPDFGNIIANDSSSELRNPPPGLRIIINKDIFSPFMDDDDNNDGDGENNIDPFGRFRAGRPNHRKKKSENFEIVKSSGINFSNVGGYDNVKKELDQCIDIISNYTKYAKYNVRVPKGLIFEGPPGNGKTLLAKALAGEANTSFIPVSGSQFQEKYVGVGASRIRELFDLACDNLPCIIFIDEIDALGRKRSSDGDISGNERDSTLNELLVALDGFKNTTGVFLIGATNRADLLDEALLRPGRVDKRIFINNPDSETRKRIFEIHLQGKPYDNDVVIDDLVENSSGFSGAQIENLLNEAMLLALRDNRENFSTKDLDIVFNKMIAGWQPTEHTFTQEMIDQIAIHELGHAIVGMLSKHHGKMTKVVINLSAPNTPAYTVFEPSGSNIVTREALFEHLMILLAGRIAEEVFYDVSVTTGAINDFEEALKLAEKMVCYYGMGKEIIYPSKSEKYKELIDSEVANLIHDAYGYAEFIIRNSKELITEGAELLKKNQLLKNEEINKLINTKYENVKLLKL
jgi:cell division protease FtsH